MNILIGITAGLIFAWIAIRIGLYVAWAVMFNLIVSIYLAISLGPLVSSKIPLEGGFGAAVVLIALAAAVFAILQGACYIFITSQYEMSFPKLFDSVTSAFVGFLAGVLIVSFINLPIGLIRQNLSAKNKNKQSYQLANSPYLDFWYNTMHSIVGTKENTHAEKLVIETIKKAKKIKETPMNTQTVEEIKEVEPAQPEIEEVKKDQLGEPPEFDFDKI